MRAEGHEVYSAAGNVGDWDSTKTAIDRARKEAGEVDVLVNNAGIARDGTFRKMTNEQWHQVIETNLNSLFHVTKQVIDGMLDRGWGRIINISSVNGQRGQFGQTNYSTAKAGSTASRWRSRRRWRAVESRSTPFHPATSAPRWFGR
jgi:acetoacetyl-CoA reductase